MIFIRMPCLIRIIELKWKIKAVKANMMLNSCFHTLKHFDGFSFCLNISSKGDIVTSFQDLLRFSLIVRSLFSCNFCCECGSDTAPFTT